MARAWNRYRLLAARLSIDQQHHAVRTPFIFVGNNEYAVEGFQLGARTALDRGRLSIFIAPEIGRFEILMLPLRGLAKRLTPDSKFECYIAEQATIELSRHRASVALDGEVTVMQSPLQYRVRRRRPASHRAGPVIFLRLPGMRTIVHLSDIHFGRIEPALVDQLSLAVARLAPDLLAVSGDLTQRAKRSEFTAARTLPGRAAVSAAGRARESRRAALQRLHPLRHAARALQARHHPRPVAGVP